MMGLRLYSEYSVFNTVTAGSLFTNMRRPTRLLYLFHEIGVHPYDVELMRGTWSTGIGNQIQFTHLTLCYCSRTPGTTVNSKTTIQRDCTPLVCNNPTIFYTYYATRIMPHVSKQIPSIHPALQMLRMCIHVVMMVVLVLVAVMLLLVQMRSQHSFVEGSLKMCQSLVISREKT